MGLVDEFNTVQSHVLIELGSGKHPPRLSLARLQRALHYLEPEVVLAAVERLQLVGAVCVGGEDEVWVIPVVRYLVEIHAIED